MKAVIIYSGKGGVGKTTTTANLARLLTKQGNKVFIIDADINTPSMNTEFDGEHPHENIWVHSTGNMFKDFIYLEKAMIRKYLEDAKRMLRKVLPDFVLIDTPPSVTNVHIELLKRINISYVLFVTQPTKLSFQDVIRTMDFFSKQIGGDVKCGIAENMCYDTEKRTYPIKLVAQILMQDKMDTSNILEHAKDEYQKILDQITEAEPVVIEEYTTENGYDETFDITDITIKENRNGSRGFRIAVKYDSGESKSIILPQLKFLSARTWKDIRRFIIDYEGETNIRTDKRIENCTPEKVERLLKAFSADENAYFMITSAPPTEVHLIPGEIGLASLLIGQRYHNELPRISYSTSKGSIVCFPDEVMPVDMEMLQQMLSEGYRLTSDGRYLPPKEMVEECYNTFGRRIGLYDDWEKTYNEWIE